MYVVSTVVVRTSHDKNNTGLQSDCTYLHQEIDNNIVKSQLQYRSHSEITSVHILNWAAEVV